MLLKALKIFTGFKDQLVSREWRKIRSADGRTPGQLQPRASQKMGFKKKNHLTWRTECNNLEVKAGHHLEVKAGHGQGLAHWNCESAESKPKRPDQASLSPVGRATTSLLSSKLGSRVWLFCGYFSTKETDTLGCGM